MTAKQILKSGALMLLLLGGTGCVLGPNFRNNDAKVEAQWRAIANSHFTGEPANTAEWWKVFNDPTLDRLVSEAFTQNLSLQAAALRVVQARIGRTAAGELFFPILTAEGSAAHVNFSQTVKPDVKIDKPSKKGSSGDLLEDKIAAGISSNLPTVSVVPKLDMYDIHGAALWELDLWGGKRRRFESAGAQVDASYASYDNMMVLLAAEVANTYIEYRTTQNRLQSLQANVAAQKKFLAIADDRTGKKLVPQADTYLVQTFVKMTEANIPELEAHLRSQENTLCVLLGKTPQALDGDLQEVAPIPTAPQKIFAGVPADLLRRRPDVRNAEALAHSECARIGMAKAQILPSFSLFGMLGLKSTDSDRLFDRKSGYGAYGAGVNASGLLFYPILIENVRGQDAQFEEAMLAYRQTVLQASAEVENAMIAFDKGAQRVELARESAEAAQKATGLAVDDYQEGRAQVSPALTAITTLASQQDEVLQQQGQVCATIVAAYKALGGGWESRAGRDLVPDEIKQRLKDNVDWWSFFGKLDLKTARTEKSLEAEKAGQ